MQRLACAAALALAACAAAAQSPHRAPRIAYLGFLGEPAERPPMREAFVRGLREHGLDPDRHVELTVRRYASNAELRVALQEILPLGPSVIFVGPPQSARLATQIAPGIPVVCGSCGDPVENGLAASLARPGGNVTGLASLSAELIGKRVGLLQELFPGRLRLAVLVFPANPGTPATLKALHAVAGQAGVELQRMEIRVEADLDSAFRLAAEKGVRAVVLQDDPSLRTASARIVALSLQHRLPVSTGLPELVEEGVFMGYGPDRAEMAQRAAAFVDKILKGAKAAELPFEQASKLDLVMNMKTARALGVAVPASYLLRANRVIE
jgi:putative ABC transport system substrate-binding protein